MARTRNRKAKKARPSCEVLESRNLLSSDFVQWMENERTPAGTCGGCGEPLRHWEATFAQCGILLCPECAKKSPCRRTKPPNQQPPAEPVLRADRGPRGTARRRSTGAEALALQVAEPLTDT